MGNETFCPDCGHLDEYCVCDVTIQYLEPVEPNFRFEYAMEKLSGHPTQFWEIQPEYE
jgi:hypothetical protein